MIWGQFHSATISLDAFGETIAQVTSTMMARWDQYARATNQDPEMLSKRAEHIKFQTIEPGFSQVNYPRPVVKANKGPYPPRRDWSEDAEDDTESV